METIPRLGFGTYRLRNDIAYNSSLSALSLGYNHIDTANLYKNEEEIGKAIKKSGIERNKLWITTKIQIKDIKKGKDAMYKSIRNSLAQLGTEYLDLVLLHGPVEECLLESWRYLEDIMLGNVEEFRRSIRHIGVSNYNIYHLDIILKNHRIKPYVNQFEVSPFLKRDDLVSYCKENNIIVVAHTSLVKGEKFNDIKLTNLSDQIGITKPLILLSWALNKDMVVLPRSSDIQHIRENILCLETRLDHDIIKKLDDEYNVKYCTHPQYI